MNSKSKIFLILWSICLILFNLIVFIAPIELTQSFWLGYTFITFAFIGQLYCAYSALKNKKSKKFFYKIPLIAISAFGLFIILIAGSVCMVLTDIPNWCGSIICLLTFGITALTVISAETAAQVVENIDRTTEDNITFIKSITTDAELLMNRAKPQKIKNQCKKVYEALRYSDPVSSTKLYETEQRIREEFDILTDAVVDDNLDFTESATRQLLTLIDERNRKCKELKR